MQAKEHWYEIVFGLLSIGIIACVISLFITKASDGSSGPKGVSGKHGVKGDTGATGNDGPSGDPGSSIVMTSSATNIVFVPEDADYVKMQGASPHRLVFPGLVSKLGNIVTISCSQIPVEFIGTSYFFYLRFELPFAIASLDKSNIIFSNGYCQTFNVNSTTGVPVVVEQFAILSDTVVACRYVSMKNNIYGPGIVKPYQPFKFQCSFNMQYKSA